MASSNTYNSPCAACKFLRRKCMPGCTFAPYFPPEEPTKFANVHKIFGASNVSKLLNEILPHQREDAVNSLAYEAEARIRDPVYGCVGAISFLQRQVERLEKELNVANANLIRYACNEIVPQGSVGFNMQMPMEMVRRSGGTSEGGGGGTFYQNPRVPFGYPQPLQWSDNNSSCGGIGSGDVNGGGQGGI